MGRVFITGDCHGRFDKIFNFCQKVETTDDDIMIIDGDAGINYYLNGRDNKTKKKLSKLPITLLVVHGNHEERAWNIDTYQHDVHTIGDNHIIAWSEPKYPNLLFLDDYRDCSINGKRFLFLGGAYSVDKYFRLARGLQWFVSEQISGDDMKTILLRLKADKVAWQHSVHDESKSQFDYVVTHTSPHKYIPTEMFLPMIDQSTVDQSTELFLDQVEEIVDYDKWICAHWHCEKSIDKMRFIYDDIIELE